MAHSQQLTDATLDTIAKQVGTFYPSLAGDVNQLKQLAELAETFSIWLLCAEDIVAGSNDLSDLAQNTGRWHSQIWIDGKPKGVARSVSLGGDASNWSVRQILEGDLANTIDEAIDWVDTNVKGDPLVHILEIPAFQITALWLVSDTESNVVIARLPDGSQFLERLILYSSNDFLDALRKERFIIGIH